MTRTLLETCYLEECKQTRESNCLGHWRCIHDISSKREKDVGITVAQYDDSAHSNMKVNGTVKRQGSEIGCERPWVLHTYTHTQRHVCFIWACWCGWGRCGPSLPACVRGAWLGMWGWSGWIYRRGPTAWSLLLCNAPLHWTWREERSYWSRHKGINRRESGMSIRAEKEWGGLNDRAGKIVIKC